MKKEEVDASDFGLVDSEKTYSPFDLQRDIDYYMRRYGSLLSYSVDRPYDSVYTLSGESVYTLSGENVHKWYGRAEYTLEYYCPRCGARYSFKGTLTRKDSGRITCRTICLSCGNTIEMGI